MRLARDNAVEHLALQFGALVVYPPDVVTGSVQVSADHGESFRVTEDGQVTRLACDQAAIGDFGRDRC